VGREFEAGTGAGVGLKGCGGAGEAAKGARAIAVLEQGHAGRRLADRGAACERRGVGGLAQRDGAHGPRVSGSSDCGEATGRSKNIYRPRQ
jgi:hypothetical protein